MSFGQLRQSNCREDTDDGYDEDETHIECAITVDGSALHIDYDGTSKQIDRGLNSVIPSRSVAMCAM